ncbi:Ras_guanine nucleotide exchange factor [Hexamita inflata]|uniref:Ras guanine nucleotide exchange factor n=2 Tax=Hexamita inflata TaxID=28002 RepID=A0AA86NAW9_9EUKA|nr:Ras guanine nucleotide exchange factor [Hexamita inflata]CAI9972858.1 Ras guanine nucleotide exchange factor [Hexamita inflata]
MQLDFLKSAELIQPHLQPIIKGSIRVFVTVSGFTPFYFDVKENLDKAQILYKANQTFVKQIETCAPLNLKFNRFIRFLDGVLIFADVAQLLYAKEKPINRPMIAEPFGLEQEFGPAYPIDNGDFSVFSAHKFPSSLYPNQLIMYLTNPHHYDEGSTQNMITWASFLFYRQNWFTTSLLIDKLIERFNMRPPIKQNEPDFLSYWFIQHQVPVRLHVLKFFDCWIRYYRDDFQAEDTKKAKAFFETLQDSYFAPQALSLLELIDKQLPVMTQAKFSCVLKCIDKDVKNGKQHLPEYFPGKLQFPMFSMYLGKQAAPRSILLAQIQCEFQEEYSVTAAERNFQYVSAQDLASCSIEALTYTIYYFLYETYRNIHPRELFGSPQSKPETQKLAPNVNLHIRRTNIVNHFVAMTVLTTKKKVQAYERFVIVAQKLKELKNYDAAMAVINGLNWAPVDRIGLSNELKGPVAGKCQELKNLFGLGDNWQTIRKEINSTSSDELCVPVLSICLKDVFMTEEGQGKFEDGRCNMLRAFIVWRAVHSYIRFQAAGFKQMLFNEQLYKELCEQQEIDEDRVWEQSFKVMPREA